MLEGDLVTNGNDLKVQGYEPRNEETIMKVFNKILEQGKYSLQFVNHIIIYNDGLRDVYV